jgi:hypothetical protein
VAISFCDRAERATLQAIERLTRQAISVEAQPAGVPAPSSTPAKASAVRKTSVRRARVPASATARHGKRSEARRRAVYAGRKWRAG